MTTCRKFLEEIHMTNEHENIQNNPSKKRKLKQNTAFPCTLSNDEPSTIFRAQRCTEPAIAPPAMV